MILLSLKKIFLKAYDSQRRVNVNYEYSDTSANE
jgi:hypothetical protein